MDTTIDQFAHKAREIVQEWRARWKGQPYSSDNDAAAEADIAERVATALREAAAGQAEMLPYSCFAHDAVQVFFTNAEYGCPLCAEYDQPALSEIREAVEKMLIPNPGTTQHN